MNLRNRPCNALTVGLRRVVPAQNLQIEALAELRTGFIAQGDHPLAARA